jgi:hypothetical protein
MQFFNSILTTLFAKHVVGEIKDNTEFCECKVKDCHGLKQGIEPLLSDLIASDTKDAVYLILNIDGDLHNFDSIAADNKLFFEDWEKARLKEKLEDEISLTIRINKTVHEHSWMQVYHPDGFFAYLQSLSLLEFLNLLSDQFKKADGRLCFFIPDISEPFGSDAILFVNDKSLLIKGKNDLADRQKAWEKYKTVSYFAGKGLDNLVILPEDLILLPAADVPDALFQRFNLASLVLLLGIVYDYSELNDSRLSLKLNGYKTLRTDVELNQVITNCSQHYFDIYLWLNSGGSLNDKIGLARNLISLHLDKDGYTIPESVFFSIKSGYRLYEKQNVKQYIELRNKMSDQLLGFNEKASKIVETFASSLHKSILGVVSLYASLIIAKVFTSQNVISAFTLDVSVISLVFLCISYAVFRMSLSETKEQKDRFVNSYANMKRRYEDLLEAEDIKKILNDDEEYNRDIDFIDKKTKANSRLWIIVIGLLGLVTIFLHGFYRIKS